MEKKENNNGEGVDLEVRFTAVFGILIPFSLFWLGILIPVVTTRFIFLCLTFLPFYAYCFLVVLFFMDEDLEDSIIFSLFMSFFTSIVCAFVATGILRSILFLNAVPAIIITIVTYVYVCAVRDNSRGSFGGD